MLDGYVTFKDLVLITGLSEKLIRKFILEGLAKHQIHCPYKKPVSENLFSLDEVERWFRVHVY